MDKEKKPKKWMKWIMKLIIVLLISMGFVGGCSHVNKRFGLKDDHALEELIEARLREEFGIHIDLTPHTLED